MGLKSTQFAYSMDIKEVITAKRCALGCNDYNIIQDNLSAIFVHLTLHQLDFGYAANVTVPFSTQHDRLKKKKGFCPKTKLRLIERLTEIRIVSQRRSVYQKLPFISLTPHALTCNGTARDVSST